MSLYIVRVELHSATEDDYETLHSSMSEEGFSRIIKGDNGVLYHLPTAEYTVTSSVGRSGILASAKKAATTTGNPFAVLVSEATGGCTWEGLEVAR